VTTLVLCDGVRLSRIAAVTFTEKAGAELRDRLREQFEAIWRAGGPDRQTAEQALDDLDGAAIGTLHAFGQRLLTEHPIEAGLPPIIEVLDEVGSSVAFDERWSELQAELLDDDDIAAPLLLGMAMGMRLGPRPVTCGVARQGLGPDRGPGAGCAAAAGRGARRHGPPCPRPRARATR